MSVATGEQWRPWSLQRPEDLGRYVAPEEVGRYLQVPRDPRTPPARRLEAVWAAAAAKGIGYANEALASTRNGQVVRPPAEVLKSPGSGTCLDLALTLAGAFELAELPAAVIVLAAAEPGGVGHALVAVSLSGSWGDDAPVGGVWRERPEWLDQARTGWDDAFGSVVVLDPVRMSARNGAAADPQVSLNEAVTAAMAALESPATRGGLRLFGRLTGSPRHWCRRWQHSGRSTCPPTASRCCAT